LAGCPFFMDYTLFDPAPTGTGSNLCVQLSVSYGGTGTIRCTAATYNDTGGVLNVSAVQTFTGPSSTTLKPNVAISGANAPNTRMIFMYCELPEDSYINNYRYWILPAATACP
jgi:hypothetical protein